MLPGRFSGTSPTLPPVPGERPEADELFARIARRIVRLELAPVAVLFIESFRPLNFVGSQLLRFLAPFVHAFGRFPDYESLAQLLEDRDSIDRLLEAIEREEEARESRKRI